MADDLKTFEGEAELTATEALMLHGQTMVQTKTQYTTAVAVQKPRKMAEVVARCLDEARLAGKGFYYHWMVKDNKTGEKKPVQGLSIDGAMAVARNFGNCAIPVDVNETADSFIFNAAFVDLETGFNCQRLYQQRKNQTLSKKMDADRQRDIAFQIGQSKAIRNVVVKAMPEWLCKRIFNEAREAEIKGVKGENLPEARAKVIAFFSGYGVAPAQIEAYIGKESDRWTAEDIVDLRLTAKSIKEGEVTADEVFGIDASSPSPLAAAAAEKSRRGRPSKATDTPQEPPAEPPATAPGQEPQAGPEHPAEGKSPKQLANEAVHGMDQDVIREIMKRACANKAFPETDEDRMAIVAVAQEYKEAK